MQNKEEKKLDGITHASFRSRYTYTICDNFGSGKTKLVKMKKMYAEVNI